MVVVAVAVYKLVVANMIEIDVDVDDMDLDFDKMILMNMSPNR